MESESVVVRRPKKLSRGARRRFLPANTLSVSACLIALMVSHAACHEDASTGRERIFQIIDRFDALDTTKLPFVRVATGSWVRFDDDPPQNQYRFGFLQNDEGGIFTIRYLDLSRAKLRSTPKGTEEHRRVGYETRDLAAYARDVARKLVNTEDGESNYYTRPSTPI
jgi:hypothetical protein